MRAVRATHLAVGVLETRCLPGASRTSARSVRQCRNEKTTRLRGDPCGTFGLPHILGAGDMHGSQAEQALMSPQPMFDHCWEEERPPVCLNTVCCC